MCGIAGIIGGTPRNATQAVSSMLDAIRHRGPDGEGIKTFPTCVLGHVRLSIVDLEGGSQPMDCALTKRSVVFNGEIYGYQKLRRNLTSYPFLTSSDTEVLLALYDQHGQATPQKHGGMFSYAIWDEGKRTLFAARDRFGEKPFFYAFGRNGEFIFCSEIKGIIASRLIEPILDTDSVRHFFRYLYVHPYRTIFSNIHTLPPAHNLVYNQASHKTTIQRYWEIPLTGSRTIGLGDAAEEFRHLFEKAVEEQLVADVPVGSFLSGGLDSSTVVAVAAGMKPGLRTFSFGFEDHVSELPYALQIASRYQTSHQELTAKVVDVGELILRMDSVYDEPLADSSNIPTYLISEMASNNLKVVLSGDGADELLGGYAWWYRPLLEQEAGKTLRDRFFRLFTSRTLRYRKRYSNKPVYFSNQDLNQLGIVPDEVVYDCLCSKPPAGDITDALAMDLCNYMPGDILVKTDRASMANSLELRAPFLDADLAAFIISLPGALKIDRHSDKIILRKAYASKWTDAIRQRGKQGFGAPVPQWLKRKSVEEVKKRYLLDKNRKIYSYLDADAITRFAAEDSQKTWSLLVFAIWFENRSIRFQERR
ncbi:MAG: asparagine synthase (glutamine-hydrolyzing) [Thermodesulfobacteriota bacterium]